MSFVERMDIALIAKIHEAFAGQAEYNGYRVVGPLCGSNKDWLLRICAFRHEQYDARRAYLYAPEQQQIENNLQIDARSQHFVALHDECIVGSLRLTSAPFEFAALASSLEEAAPMFAGYVELSRLAVDAVAGREKVTSSLVVAASHWALAGGSKGIVALCRGASRVLFERYGLHATSSLPHFIPWRGAKPYALMAGAWPDLVRQTRILSEKIHIANS